MVHLQFETQEEEPSSPPPVHEKDNPHLQNLYSTYMSMNTTNRRLSHTQWNRIREHLEKMQTQYFLKQPELILTGHFDEVSRSHNLPERTQFIPELPLDSIQTLALAGA